MAAHVFGTSLTDRDYERLGRDRGIPRELAEQAQLRRVDTVTGREVIGVSDRTSEDYAGILIPYFKPGTDRVRSYRLRRDNPPVGANGKADCKYRSAPGDRVMFYYPPRVAPGWLTDTSLKILVVEGEFKALTLWRLAWHNATDVAERPAFLPLGLGGINNWRGKIGRQDGPSGERQDIKGPSPDFDRINWQNREVVLVGDSNAFSNEDVRIARSSLAKHLRGLGAHILFADIDPALGVNGIDDVCGRFGIDAALKIIGSAYDPKAKRRTAAEEAPLSEEFLAQQFEAQYEPILRYDHDRGCWYLWNPERGGWTQNRTRVAYHYARTICREVNVKKAKEFGRAKVYGGVEQIAQNSPTFAVTHELWDRDIWSLGTPGGVVDLRTGEMRQAQKADYMTKMTACVPDSELAMPVFTKFYEEITRGDGELQRYVKRIAGYSLTGSTKEEKLFFFYGPGGNGKSKFVNALAACAGDYAVNAAMEAFVERRGERHSTDIAALAGARLVTASETEKGRHWDEALIGRLTGGDPVTARFMRRDNFTFQPQFTLLILGNHQPELSGVNPANKRRFVILPFLYQPTKPDEDLSDKLRGEYPAIFHWMIEGARDWYQYGLGEMPEVVRAETDDYFEDQNYVQAWIDECCLAGPNYTDTSLNLFASWEKWSKCNGVSPGSQKTLIQTLKKQHQCKKDRSSTRRGLKGIAVKVEYKPDPRTGERDE